MSDYPILITGANGAMGSAAVRALAAKGQPVIMACRNLERAETVRERILSEYPEASLQLRLMDFGSLPSVRKSCADLAAEGVRLGGTFNNAGAIFRDPALTPDGFERSWQTDYLGPCLMTQLLLPLLEPGAPVVSMVSLSAHYVKLGRSCFDFDAARYAELSAYARAKHALLLFAVELGRRHPQLRVNVSDPGVVDTGILHLGRWFDPLADVLFRPLCKRPEKGVQPALHALESDCTLKYFVGNRCKDIPSRYLDHPDAAWLWEESRRRLGL